MKKQSNTVSWLNVSSFLLVTAVAAVVAALAPVLAHKLQVRRLERSELATSSIALDKAGLANCRGDYSYEPQEFIDNRVPGPFRMSATVMPSFQAEWGIRLFRNEVYLVRLDSKMWPPPPPPEPGKPAEVAPPMTARVHHAPLTPKTALGLEQLFSVRVSQAADDHISGYDGTTYAFVAGSSCAEVWSPDSETGAGRLVQIVELLAEHAHLTDEKDLDSSERKIGALLRSFRRSTRGL